MTRAQYRGFLHEILSTDLSSEAPRQNSFPRTEYSTKQGAQSSCLKRRLQQLELARSACFNNWSLLAAHASTLTPVGEVFAQLTPGDLVLLGARPGQGKTLMSLELIAEAIKQGHQGVFFTLEYTESDVLNGLQSIGADVALFDDRFEFDDCDHINSDYIVDRLAMAPRGSVAVVDYLQLLDQKRENLELTFQVQALKSFARKSGLIIVMISQIDRSFDPSEKSFPGLEDVRLPNPLDLTLFSKTCFLNNGEVQISATGESVTCSTSARSI